MTDSRSELMGDILRVASGYSAKELGTTMCALMSPCLAQHADTLEEALVIADESFARVKHHIRERWDDYAKEKRLVGDILTGLRMQYMMRQQ